jgi:23S rRNA pseudouridine2605 synthase
MSNRNSKNKRPSQPTKKASADPKHPRLQQVLAKAGFGSRRECESLIVEGRVEIDDQIADKLGTRVDPDTQKILVDGEVLKQERLQYFMLNKPTGVVSTNRDPSGRTRVIDLIKTDVRVFNVGRLDRTSEGLILVTNDGELANRLTHPSFLIDKRYLVEVAGAPEREHLLKLEKGVQLAEGLAKASRIEARRSTRRGTILEMTLREGRNREIRRLLASVGHKVLRLKRIAIGPVLLGDLGPGESRRLTLEEVAALKGLASRKPQRDPSARRQRELTEQSMLQDFRGRKKPRVRASKIRGPDKGPSQGRAVSRQKPAPGGRGPARETRVEDSKDSKSRRPASKPSVHGRSAGKPRVRKPDDNRSRDTRQEFSGDSKKRRPAPNSGERGRSAGSARAKKPGDDQKRRGPNR